MFGERLKLARNSRGLSLRALSASIDGIVTAQAIGKYERGEMAPNSEVAIAMAHALDVSTNYLLSASTISLETVEFRKLASTRAKERAAVEATVLDQVDRYLQVEQLLGIDSTARQEPDGAPFRVNDIAEAETASKSVRRAWNLGGSPIPDMAHLIEERGIKILKLLLPKSVDGLTCFVQSAERDDIPVVICSTAKSVERQRFTIAHELGHMVLKIPSSLPEEKVCDRFAGAFLVPEEELTREVGQRRANFGFDEFIEVKRFFGISAAALVVRMRDLGIIRQATATGIFRGIGRSWRKTEPRPLTRTESPVRFRRLCLRALAENEISVSKAAELLRIRVTEIEPLMAGTTDR